MMRTYPRAVFFKDGRAIGAGFTAASKEADKMVVMMLPSDHYDFIGPINVVGKTRAEIENEAASYEQGRASH